MNAGFPKSGPGRERPRAILIAPRRLVAVAIICIGLGFLAGWSAHPASTGRPSPDVLAAYRKLNLETSRLIAEQQAQLAAAAFGQPAPAEARVSTPAKDRP